MQLACDLLGWNGLLASGNWEETGMDSTQKKKKTERERERERERNGLLASGKRIIA
jgi:hypothetical protein